MTVIRSPTRTVLGVASSKTCFEPSRSRTTIWCRVVTVLFLARRVATRFEVHHVALGAGVVMTVLMPGLVTLELVGILPPPGDHRLFEVLALGVFVLYAAIILSMTLVGNLIANVTDEHELSTGERQEGLLFAAAMFTQDFDNVMVPPKCHILGTPNRAG